MYFLHTASVPKVHKVCRNYAVVDAGKKYRLDLRTEWEVRTFGVQNSKPSFSLLQNLLRLEIW
jgi:hypothetical protein